MTGDGFLEAALRYRSLGLHPIPCEPRGKRPLVEWKSYQNDPPHPDEVEAWWTRWPDANVGLVMGRGDFAVDLDGGPEAEALLERRRVRLPPGAPRSRTGKGAHVFLHSDYPVPDKVRLAWDGRSAQVDVRGVGYVIVPPSIHPTGATYTWEVPLTLPLPAAPPELLRLLAVKPELEPEGDRQEGGETDSPHWVAEALRGVSKGARDQTGTRLAGYFLGKNVPASIVEAVLLDTFARRCAPPFPAEELRKCVRSIAGRENGGGAAEPDTAGTSFSRPLSELLSVPDEPIPWLIEGLLVAVANGFIGGEPKSLKSWLALYLALCLSLGIAVFGRYLIPRPVRVLYIQEEDGERRVRRRVRKLLAGLGVEAPPDEYFRYAIKAGLLLDDKVWLARLRAELAEYRPDIVVGDVFELMHTRDGDRRAELKPLFYSLDRLREEFGCGFLLADHFKKAALGTSKRGGQRLSGTVGKHAWGECSLYLFPLPGRNRVRVETELKDAPSETFGLALEDTPEGGVLFRWEADAQDREAETKAKVLAAMEGLAPPGEWITAKRAAEAAGMSPNSAKKYLDLLTDEDRKAERQKLQAGKVKAWHWRLRA